MGRSLGWWGGVGNGAAGRGALRSIARFALDFSGGGRHTGGIVPLFALTTLEKLQQVPTRTWWMIALGVGAFVILMVLVRLAGQVNKFLLGGIMLIVVFLSLIHI